MNTQQEIYKTLTIPYKILFNLNKELREYIDIFGGNGTGSGVTYSLQETAYNEIKELLKEAEGK